jgi:hypothetical protein
VIGSDGGGAPWWLAGGAAALWAAREFIGAVLSRKKNRTETDANIELINSLREGLDRQGKRIAAMEEAQNRIGSRLDEEIKLRMEAQEEAHRLKLRVQTLEAEMRRLGVVIPPEVH